MKKFLDRAKYLIVNFIFLGVILFTAYISHDPDLTLLVMIPYFGFIVYMMYTTRHILWRAIKHKS